MPSPHSVAPSQRPRSDPASPAPGEAGCRDLPGVWRQPTREAHATLANEVLTYRRGVEHDTAADDATLTADRATFMQSAFAPSELGSLLASGALQVDGDPAAWTEMLAALDSPDPSFDIVLPCVGADPVSQSRRARRPGDAGVSSDVVARLWWGRAVVEGTPSARARAEGCGPATGSPGALARVA